MRAWNFNSKFGSVKRNPHHGHDYYSYNDAISDLILYMFSTTHLNTLPSHQKLTLHASLLVPVGIIIVKIMVPFVEFVQKPSRNVLGRWCDNNATCVETLHPLQPSKDGLI